MRSHSAVIGACWASSATSNDEDSSRPQLLGGARQRIEGNPHPAADHRREQADQGDAPEGGHSRKVTSHTCVHVITPSANWPYPALTARCDYKSIESSWSTAADLGRRFVRVEVGAYTQSGVGRIHAGQHFQHVPQVGDHGFGRRAATRRPGSPGAVGQRRTKRRPHEYIWMGPSEIYWW